MPTESQLNRLRNLLTDFRALIAEETAWQAAVKAHWELPATERVWPVLRDRLSARVA